MFKKNLFSGLILGLFLINANIAFAQETHYKTPLIRISSNKIMQKNISKKCDNCKKSPCECQKPCDPCEKPKAAWKNSDCCDRDIKYIYEFFNKADCVLGLTATQQQKSNELKANAAREITELKREIATMQSQLKSTDCTQTCNASKEIRKLNRNINKNYRLIKKVKKNAKKEYKKMLNGTQKQMYRNYKKAIKAKGLEAYCLDKQPCSIK